MQVCPALEQAPHRAASAAASMSASWSTMTASLPPASMMTGVRVSAQAAITRLPVAVEPVKATLSTPAWHSAAPVSPRPVTTVKTGRPTDSWNVRASHAPTPGVYSRRLEDHGVAGGEGVDDRAHRREDRVVPRADDADDAERLVRHRRGLVGHQQTGGDLAALEVLLGVAGRPGDVVDGQGGLEHRVAVRLAGLVVHDLGELGQAPGHRALPDRSGAPCARRRSARAHQAACSRAALTAAVTSSAEWIG